MPFLLGILIFANLASWSIISDFYQQKPFVSFLDIGQGNNVLISNPRTVLLYDTGPNGFKTISAISKFLPFYKKRIDILILSHPDADHYNGSFEILKRFNVSLIITPPLSSEESGWKELMNLAHNKEIPVMKLKALDKIQTPFENFLIINPPANNNLRTSQVLRFETDNENSLVVKFSQNNKLFLLTGDIDKKVEKYLAAQYNLKSDYLLVPHHGSKYSSSEELLKEVNPQLAIIQTGRNKYGHPHKETLNRLKKLKIQFWRTDLNGNLMIIK
jgi:competence protein ComEC